MRNIRILLADDHNLFRQGLRQICELKGGFQVVGEAADGEAAVALAAELNPDIILIDINMPRLNGIDATTQIIENNPAARVIILTMFREDQHLFNAIKAGAQGYLLKNADAQELIDGVHQVVRGEALIDAQMTARVMTEFRRISKDAEDNTAVAQLTSGEMDVLQLAAQGLSNKSIADKLDLSPQTIANRMRQVYQKLGVDNRTQAALYALRMGWVELGA